MDSEEEIREHSCLNNNKMSKRIDFVKSIASLNEGEISARIKEDQLRLKKLEFAHTISPLENPMSIRDLRKDIARLQTFLKKKQLGF